MVRDVTLPVDVGLGTLPVVVAVGLGITVPAGIEVMDGWGFMFLAVLGRPKTTPNMIAIAEITPNIVIMQPMIFRRRLARTSGVMLFGLLRSAGSFGGFGKGGIVISDTGAGSACGEDTSKKGIGFSFRFCAALFGGKIGGNKPSRGDAEFLGLENLKLDSLGLDVLGLLDALGFDSLGLDILGLPDALGFDIRGNAVRMLELLRLEETVVLSPTFLAASV